MEWTAFDQGVEKINEADENYSQPLAVLVVSVEFDPEEDVGEKLCGQVVARNVGQTMVIQERAGLNPTTTRRKLKTNTMFLSCFSIVRRPSVLAPSHWQLIS